MVDFSMYPVTERPLIDKKNVFWIKVLDQTAEPDFERLVDFVIRTYHYDFLLCMFAKQVYCSPNLYRYLF